MATKNTKKKKSATSKKKSTNKSNAKPKKIEVEVQEELEIIKKPEEVEQPEEVKEIEPIVKAKTTKTSPPDTLMKKVIKLAICAILPLIIGGVSALITGDMMTRFDEFEQPLLSPPSWLFPVAWTILYVLMGVASFFILQQKSQNRLEKAGKIAWLVIYGLQLGFNFMWSIFFFSLNMFDFAMYWLLAMWVMILILVFMANRRSQVAMWCMLPLALWVTFAAYLNLMIMMLN